MHPSQALLNFITQPDMENVKLVAYQDGGGMWTLGAGATRIPDGVGGTRPVAQGDTCTLAQAQQWAAADMATAFTAVAQLVHNPSQNEADAFGSLFYNIGVGNARKVSAVGLFNAGDKAGAARHILLWNKVAGMASNGLLKRRMCEAIMLLGGPPWQISMFANEAVPVLSTPTLTRCMAAYAV